MRTSAPTAASDRPDAPPVADPCDEPSRSRRPARRGRWRIRPADPADPAARRRAAAAAPRIEPREPSSSSSSANGSGSLSAPLSNIAAYESGIRRAPSPALASIPALNPLEATPGSGPGPRPLPGALRAEVRHGVRERSPGDAPRRPVRYGAPYENGAPLNPKLPWEYGPAPANPCRPGDVPSGAEIAPPTSEPIPPPPAPLASL